VGSRESSFRVNARTRTLGIPLDFIKEWLEPLMHALTSKVEQNPNDLKYGRSWNRAGNM
jgi:hypothetical protein